MDEFDVVVVGAGSAGAVLAARLSQDPARHVLLLDAGPDHRSADAPPGIRSANYLRSFAEPGRLWPTLTARRTPTQQELPFRRGRGVGGSSSVNGLAAIRGIPEDYNRWRDELGCVGWGWDEMLATFVGLECDADYGDGPAHGRHGPLPLQRSPMAARSGLDRALYAALTRRGHPNVDDYHAPRATGISRWALTVRDGERVSTNDAYLEPSRGRPNLTVRGDTLVDRVALDGRRAVGVVTSTGESIAAGTVIICSGTIHSPAILQRSAIGVDDDLRVGANLKDHAVAWFGLSLRETGRKKSSDGPVVHSVLRYSSGLADAGNNDMQIVWFNAAGPGDEGLATARLGVAVMRVYSHGTVRLRSNDPHRDPHVDFNLLSDERDLIRLRAGVHRLTDLVADDDVATVVDTVTPDTAPLTDLHNDAAIDAWLTTSVTDYVHPVGTCRMGAPDEPAAVVDTSCHVIGYERLLVCDASVMPDIPRANTHLTTVAIAEHLAARIDRR